MDIMLSNESLTWFNYMMDIYSDIDSKPKDSFKPYTSYQYEMTNPECLTFKSNQERKSYIKQYKKWLSYHKNHKV
jgi:hypothetical protein